MSAPSAQHIAEQSAAAMWADDHATQGLGMTLDAIGPGHAKISMRVTKAMTNGHGICHGGFIFTLADSAFAFACNSHNLRAVAQHCAVSFIAPGKLDDHLTAEAREISRTGRSGLTDVTVTNQSGTVIAHFRGASRLVKGELVPGLTP